MSEDPGQGAKKSPASKDIHTSKGGGGSKLLIGAAALVILAGAGFAAWQNFAPSQSANPQSAYNESYADEPMSAGPLDSSDSLSAESASIEDESIAEPAAAETPRPAPARRQSARTEPVPEQTIGITPASATTTSPVDDDEIVVTARRPVWTQTPSARRLSALYPANALDRGREGEAALACVVEERGALDCDRVSSTPGFGNAALRVSRTFRHSTTLANGESAVGTPVNLRVVFRIEDEQRGRRFASR